MGRNINAPNGIREVLPSATHAIPFSETRTGNCRIEMVPQNTYSLVEKRTNSLRACIKYEREGVQMRIFPQPNKNKQYPVHNI